MAEGPLPGRGPADEEPDRSTPRPEGWNGPRGEAPLEAMPGS